MEVIPIALIALSITESAFSSESRSCQVPTESRNLADFEGEVRYNGTYRHENCSWNLPQVNGSSHVLSIYLQTVNMVYTDGPTTDCSANLILPEMRPLCRMPSTPCFVYSPPESTCTFSKVAETVANISSTCSSLLWHNVDSLPRSIRMEAHQPDYKEFSLVYKLTSCMNQLDERVSPPNAEQTSTSDKIDRPESAKSSPAALIAVCVALVLVVTLVILYFAYKKLVHSRHRFEKPSENPTEFTSAMQAQSNEYHSDSEAAFNGNMPSNEYEEISTDRFRPSSHELVTNALY